MKKFLSVALALAMTLSLVVVGASAKSFTDNSKIKYGEAVDVVSAVKIVDGYTDGSFNPANTLTRGAAAKIICNMMLGPTTASALGVSTAPFKDVSVKNVFAGYIAYCAKQGIINGYADKTFRPSGTVTGYQFLKMLLGALGYDSTIEGFTGTNWEVTVAKLASNLKLFSGNDTFNGNKAMTREEACLYAYNTLTTNMVEYETKGSSIVVNGITINQGASKAKPIARTTGTDYTGAAETATGTLQFCEQYFPKLTYSNTTDAFQAPAEKWKNGSSTIGSYTSSADETYTAPVSVGKIYSDLGLSAAPKTLTVYEDGKQVAATDTTNYHAIVRGSADTYGGNGTKTEVFANNSAKTDITIVMINTYVGRVAGVTAATAAKDRYVTVSPLSAPAGLTNTFETDKFAAKDLVSYTAAWNGSSAYEIQDMNALTKTATGKLASYTAGKTLTVADKTYDLSAKYATEDLVKGLAKYTPGSSDMDVYCDANGYVLYVEGTQGVTNYATVIGKGSDTAYGGTSTGVTLLLADGTQKAVTAKMATGSSLTGTNVVSDVTGDLVTYAVDTNGVYTLTVVQQYSSTDASTVKFDNGQSALKINNTTTLYTTNSTVFFVAKKAAGASSTDLPTYSVYTGYAKMPTLTAGDCSGIAYSKNSANQVDAVYLGVKNLSGISAVNTFVLKNVNSAKTTDANGTYYVLPAIVDGKVTTVKIGDILGTSTGLIALNNVLTDNGIITSASNVTSSPVTGIAAADKGVIGVGTGNSTTYLAFNDKTAVYTVDKDYTAFTASSVSAIATDPTVNVYYTVDGTTHVATNIILAPKAASIPVPVTGKYSSVVDATVAEANMTALDLSNVANFNVDNTFAITVMHIVDGANLQTQVKEALAIKKYTNLGTMSFSTTGGNHYEITATNPDGINVTLTLPVANIASYVKIGVNSVNKYVASTSKVHDICSNVTDSATDFAKLVDGSYEAGSAVVQAGHNYDATSAQYVSVTPIATPASALTDKFNITYQVDSTGATTTAPTYIKAGSTLKVILTAKVAVADAASDTITFGLAVAANTDIAFGNATGTATTTVATLTSALAVNDTVTATYTAAANTTMALASIVYAAA